jgi:hypothetical protein
VDYIPILKIYNKEYKFNNNYTELILFFSLLPYWTLDVKNDGTPRIVPGVLTPNILWTEQSKREEGGAAI